MSLHEGVGATVRFEQTFNFLFMEAFQTPILNSLATVAIRGLDGHTHDSTAAAARSGNKSDDGIGTTASNAVTGLFRWLPCNLFELYYQVVSYLCASYGDAIVRSDGPRVLQLVALGATKSVLSRDIFGQDFTTEDIKKVLHTTVDRDCWSKLSGHESNPFVELHTQGSAPLFRFRHLSIQEALVAFELASGSKKSVTKFWGNNKKVKAFFVAPAFRNVVRIGAGQIGLYFEGRVLAC